MSWKSVCSIGRRTIGSGHRTIVGSSTQGKTQTAPRRFAQLASSPKPLWNPLDSPFTIPTPTQITTLGNGTRVASESIPGETATVGVFIDAGSRYENPGNNGAAHFLEHMAFKGTKSITQYQLESEIENIGGHLNAYTSREQTVYYAKVFKKDVERAVHILSDILQHALLDERAIERERGVILREMEEVNKQYEELLLDLLHGTCFRNTGLGMTILGPVENINSLKKADLRDYIDTHYTSKRFVIAGAGAIDHNHLVELTNKYFGALPQQPLPTSRSPVNFDPAVFTGSDVRHRYNSMKECHIAMAYEGSSWTSEYAYPIMVIQGILGAWDRSSPIARHSASKLARDFSDSNLVQSYMSFNTAYNDTGLFGAIMCVPEESVHRLPEVLQCFQSNLLRLCDGVTDEEVERSKTLLKAQMLNQLDSTSLIAEDIGRQMLTYGRRMTAAEVFARIDAIQTDDVRRTAHRFFNDEDHALAAVGPIDALPSYEDVRKQSVA